MARSLSLGGILNTHLNFTHDDIWIEPWGRKQAAFLNNKTLSDLLVECEQATGWDMTPLYLMSPMLDAAFSVSYYKNQIEIRMEYHKPSLARESDFRTAQNVLVCYIQERYLKYQPDFNSLWVCLSPSALKRERIRREDIWDKAYSGFNYKVVPMGDKEYSVFESSVEQLPEIKAFSTENPNHAFHRALFQVMQHLIREYRTAEWEKLKGQFEQSYRV